MDLLPSVPKYNKIKIWLMDYVSPRRQVISNITISKGIRQVVLKIKIWKGIRQVVPKIKISQRIRCFEMMTCLEWKSLILRKVSKRLEMFSQCLTRLKVAFTYDLSLLALGRYSFHFENTYNFCASEQKDCRKFCSWAYILTANTGILQRVPISFNLKNATRVNY